MCRLGISLVACLFLVYAGGHPSHSSMTLDEKRTMREKVLEMFHHAYNSYMEHAYPADELMPLSCKGRVRGVDPSRGDVDDALGKKYRNYAEDADLRELCRSALPHPVRSFRELPAEEENLFALFSLTLIDTLDTLAVLGEVEEFEEAVRFVIRDVSFDNDVVVSVFETNIRVLGGLLGGHFSAIALKNSGKGMLWYKNELVGMAKEIGYRLLPAFNTSTGIPYPRVNLKYGIHHPSSNAGTESDTCTACAGTMIMEFGALSRLTGEPIFETEDVFPFPQHVDLLHRQKAQKAMEAIWIYRSRHSDLVGTVINIHNGDWVRKDSSVGAGIDSYYEYCLKAYILLGDETYLERFNRHYKSIMQYMNQGPLFLSVQMHQPDRTAHAYMDALQAFWPGLQVLKGDLKKAIETHQMLYEVSKKHTFLPEAFTMEFEVHWGQHPLRPELVESTYFLYEATGDPYYLQVGKHIVEKINEHARVPCGFAALRDVRTLSHEDRMDSFVLAETFKYLYLLFTEKEDLAFNMNQFIFTTEAHLLPLSLSTATVNESASQQLKYNVTLSADNEHEYTCPITQHNQGSTAKFAQEVRRNSHSQAQGSCPKKKQGFTFSSNKPPRLRAEQFVPGNQEHVAILKSMGITMIQTKDGRIQLMQTASAAQSNSDAEDGIKFMQEMIELAKRRSDEAAVQESPRVVQLMSAPYNGNVVLDACPARFGLDLSRGDVGISAEVNLGEPFKGCSALTNADDLKHRIVVLERGECMFIDKARQAQAAGAVGAIIIDNVEGSSSDTQPIFAMSNDEGNSDDVKIPAVLLFSEQGRVLNNAIIALEDTNHRLTVRLAAKATGAAAQKKSEEPVSSKGGESAIEQESNSEQDDQKEPQQMKNSREKGESADADDSVQLDDSSKTQSSGEDIYSDCKNQGLQDKQQQAQSPTDGEERTSSVSKKEAMHESMVLGKEEIHCSSEGTTGRPALNQGRDDSATEDPQDEANTEARRTEDMQSASKSTKDASLANEQKAESLDRT